MGFLWTSHVFNELIPEDCWMLMMFHGADLPFRALQAIVGMPFILIVGLIFSCVCFKAHLIHDNEPYYLGTKLKNIGKIYERYSIYMALLTMEPELPLNIPHAIDR